MRIASRVHFERERYGKIRGLRCPFSSSEHVHDRRSESVRQKSFCRKAPEKLGRDDQRAARKNSVVLR